MSNTDVEKTMREIRERVRVQLRKQEPAPEHQAANSKQGDDAALESLRANLSVIERSWNRLPPLTSYRSGWLADLELWCKRLLKRASHWFTWEQVNFNSATSNSLHDVLIVLSAHEEMLSELHKQLERVTDASAALRAEFQERPAEDLFTAFAERAARDKSTETQFTANKNFSIADRHRIIDAEIDSLARRIEELRARKARLD